MNPLSQPVRCDSGVTSVSAVLSLLLALCGCFAAGCGSAGMPSVTVPPPAAPPTSVTVVVSSTANDQFTSFYVDITSISLTNQAGTMVSVLAAPQSKAFTQTQEAEFIHLNGQMAPFLTAMVPQNVYTSATLTYTYAQFTYVRLTASGGAGNGYGRGWWVQLDSTNCQREPACSARHPWQRHGRVVGSAGVALRDFHESGCRTARYICDNADVHADSGRTHAAVSGPSKGRRRPGFFRQ
jgi:hypothetical protein